ncbi:MAG: hypothetical protein AB1540_12075 [Bdellovibrionota bacterium]
MRYIGVLSNLSLISVAALLLLVTTSFAGDKDKKSEVDNDLKAHIEMHEKTAKAHERTAECLKDGKPVDECRAEFRKARPGDGQGCGMGMAPGHGRGMGKGRGKRTQ